MKHLFENLLIDLIEREGGFVNDPSDRGGATNMGVTIHTLRAHHLDINGDGDIDIEDVKALDFATVKKIYKEKYWEPARVQDLPAHLQPIYFDMVVHHGQGNAVRILQKAINAYGNQNISVDGIIGPITIHHSQFAKVNRVVAYRALFMAAIVHADDSQERFWFGWLDHRAIKFWENK